MKDAIRTAYMRWLKNAVKDSDLQTELKEMEGDERRIEDAFYTDLEFGTAGLRGVLGAGTNRMNIYTVAETSKALADYVLRYGAGERSIAIAYDSRMKSELFARTAAAVFATAGVKAYLFRELMPTPCLSYAVRTLKADAGVMVTASHNPAKYNGYKVYGPDGCQMTSKGAGIVYGIIEETDIFDDVRWDDFDTLLSAGKIEYISDELVTSYIEEVKKRSVLPADVSVDRNVAIVYTPLNGAGLKPVMRILRENGFTNVTVVEEQKEPDGLFPTCTYPNPEIPETMALGMEYCRRYQADLLLATDPDSDRVAIAVRNGEDYRILTGNETGCLLLDYIASMLSMGNRLPKRPVAVKSLVSTDLADEIAKAYGIEMKTVLTGFKYIGEQILLLEEKGEESRYIFGFEESCGYLTGTYCRDKDAVNASLLIVEMYAYYQSLGISLIKKLEEISRKFGYYVNAVRAYAYEGMEGREKMSGIMSTLRTGPDFIGERKVTKILDYKEGISGLPRADVLKFELEGKASVIVRPSGTEPKIKIYVTARGESRAEAERTAEDLFAAMGAYL